MIDIEKIKEMAFDGDLLAVQVLVEKLESYTETCERYKELYLSRDAELIETVAKLEAAERDAERYRWLRALCDQLGEALLHMCHTCTADDDYDGHLVRDALDAWRGMK